MNARPDRLRTGLRAAVLGTIVAVPLTLVVPASARSDQKADQGSDQPPVQAQTSSDAGKEAPLPQEVRQRQQFGQTVTEYLRNGRVFMITVKPRIGPTQYWNDPDGDGEFQRRTSSGINEDINLPKFRLGGW
ncbi:MAG: DUF2782 domain-containing protein [Arenicellales bacterium]